jgi:hypothetical protein
MANTLSTDFIMFNHSIFIKRSSHSVSDAAGRCSFCGSQIRMRQPHIISVSLIRFRSHFMMLTHYVRKTLPDEGFDSSCVCVTDVVVALNIQICGYATFTLVVNIHHANVSPLK